MNTDEFVELAIRTESRVLLRDAEIRFHEQGLSLSRLLHASMGLVTEAAEFQDALKKAIFYNKPVDVINLKEELGDGLWYDAIAIDELATSLGAEMKRVIKKLQVRYPDKYTDENANQRDLFEERKVLEE